MMVDDDRVYFICVAAIVAGSTNTLARLRPSGWWMVRMIREIT